MAEGNGELVDEVSGVQKSEDRGDGERTEDYPKLLEYGLDKRVRFLFMNYLHINAGFCNLIGVFLGGRKIRRYI